MFRSIYEGVLLFLAPFGLYALWLLLLQRYVLAIEHWSQRVISWLGLAGLVCAIVGIMTIGLLGDRERGTYEPARMENGRLVPGHFE
jgi:hypothetical protein